MWSNPFRMPSWTRPRSSSAACSRRSTAWPRPRGSGRRSRASSSRRSVASLGRLASGMAHEINNPLGGLFNALDTLKGAWGTRRCPPPHDRPDRARAEGHPRRGPHHARDLSPIGTSTAQADRHRRPQLLIELEACRKQLTLRWVNEGYDELRTPPVVRQVLLNLLLNACRAAPRKPGCVRVPSSTARASSPPSRTWDWLFRQRLTRADGEQASPRAPAAGSACGSCIA